MLFFDGPAPRLVSLLFAELIEESEVMVHSPGITVHIDSLEPVPRIRVLSNQQPSRDDIAAPSDTLQQAAPPEPVVVPAESVILEHDGEGR